MRFFRLFLSLYPIVSSSYFKPSTRGCEWDSFENFFEGNYSTTCHELFEKTHPISDRNMMMNINALSENRY